MYNTTSMLRTMELILGLRPMTHFDAGARPMTAAFQSQPDPAPVRRREAAHPARRAQSGRHRRGRALGAHGLRAKPTEIDDDELNDILWRAIRKDAPPPPVRSYFRPIKPLVTVAAR